VYNRFISELIARPISHVLVKENQRVTLYTLAGEYFGVFFVSGYAQFIQNNGRRIKKEEKSPETSTAFSYHTGRRRCFPVCVTQKRHAHAYQTRTYRRYRRFALYTDTDIRRSRAFIFSVRIKCGPSTKTFVIFSAIIWGIRKKTGVAEYSRNIHATVELRPGYSPRRYGKRETRTSARRENRRISHVRTHRAPN